MSRPPPPRSVQTRVYRAIVRRGSLRLQLPGEQPVCASLGLAAGEGSKSCRAGRTEGTSGRELEARARPGCGQAARPPGPTLRSVIGCIPSDHAIRHWSRWTKRLRDRARVVRGLCGRGGDPPPTGTTGSPPCAPPHANCRLLGPELTSSGGRCTTVSAWRARRPCGRTDSAMALLPCSACRRLRPRLGCQQPRNRGACQRCTDELWRTSGVLGCESLGEAAEGQCLNTMW
jgi:hypothetical protein